MMDGTWCHCVFGTYGLWLPGDPRGFRTRHHHEHVEGDYRSPPTADYTRRHDAAKQRMTRGAVVLDHDARVVTRDAIVYALRDVHGLEVLAVAVAATHVHLLAKFPAPVKPTDSIRGLRATDPVRHFVGIAKKESAKRLSRFGLQASGGVWAKRGKIVRIHSLDQQRNTFSYIARHADEGAEVWTFSDKNKKPTD